MLNQTGARIMVEMVVHKWHSQEMQLHADLVRKHMLLPTFLSTQPQQ